MRVNRHALRDMRERSGLGVTELAGRAGVSPGTICDLESGRRPGSPSTLRKIADALECNLFSLLVNPEETAKARP